MHSFSPFNAFGGKLDSSFIRPVRDLQNNIDCEATILRLYSWIEGIRQDPASYGIPSNCVEDSLKLLNAFFPKQSEGKPICPVRIRSTTGNSGSPRRMEPIAVGYGSVNSKIDIADGPNALGYIFSVASPPADIIPTFENYLLPLAVCYAWAIYLAFLCPSSAPTSVISNVPVEICITYLTQGPRVFCLGATWSGADPADAGDAGQRDNDEDAMDVWREETMIKPLFDTFPAFQRPRWNPYVRHIAIRRLNEYILGNLENDSVATPFLDPLFTGILPTVPGGSDAPGLSQYIEALSAMATLETPIPPANGIAPGFLISHTILGPKLVKLLGAVVDTIDSTLDAAKLMENSQALLAFYLTPHLFATLSKTEVPLGPKTKAFVEPVANSAPLAVAALLMRKLHSLTCHLNNVHESSDNRIKAIEQLYFIHDPKPYGRCAEAFPLYALFKGSPPESLKDLASIRGIKIKTRVLGQAVSAGAFKDSSSPTTLDEASFSEIGGLKVVDPVVVQPDVAASELIQMIRQSKDKSLGSYNDDAQTNCPKTFGLFSK